MIESANRRFHPFRCVCRKTDGQTRRKFLREITAGSAACLAGTGTLAGCAPRTNHAAAGHPQTRTVSINPPEYETAFANPLKGFRTDLHSDGGDGTGLRNPLITLARHYIRWNQIENSGSNSTDKILEFCNPRWAGVEKKNLKIIPRVYLYWPPNSYWPKDLEAGDYTSAAFLERTARLIAKLGRAWDNDPRVAYIETGIVGPCGEQWGPFPQPELHKVIGDSYVAAFKNKLCMIRYPWQWTDYSFGVFWDSWGTRKDTLHMIDTLESPQLAGSWKTRVRGGEISFGFGDPPGRDPTDTLTSAAHVEWVESLIRRGHWNHLGWVSEYDWKIPEARANGERLQNAFGYRFVLEEVSYPATIPHRGSLEVAFSVRNTGSTPFYYDWPVVICLLDEQTHECVWQEKFREADIRQWLPGDRWLRFGHWNSELFRFELEGQPACYDVPAESRRVSGRFTLPENIGRERYIPALAILDPAGNVPACRFANRNYFRGGRHPIGRIGVGVNVADPTLDSNLFDEIASDTSLGYRT